MANTDATINLVYHPDYLIHTQTHHPECRERLEHIMAELKDRKLLERVQMITPEAATVEEIARLHDPDYIRSVEQACQSGQPAMDMDTYLVPESYRVALLSAGGVLTGLRTVMADEGKTFVLNRPPGHHAERSRAMGFCLFGNAAIAAEAARQEYGLQRIAIVDWDVHHGNGTQHLLEDDGGVLYISIHQHPCFPGTGQVDEVGRGNGEGYTINIPAPAGSGDAEYRLAFERVIVPALEQFDPELLIVSAGQDAYRQDPLAGMQLTHQAYYEMAQSLAGTADRFANGRMLLCLEGGYHLKGQAGAVVQILNAIGDWGLELSEHSPQAEPGSRFQQLIDRVVAVHGHYWRLT